MNREKAAKAADTGKSCLERNSAMEAILHFTESVKWDSGYVEGYLGRAEAFMQMEYYYMALEDTKKVLEMRPKMIAGYLKKAEIEFAAEDFLAARKTYEVQKGLEVEKMNEDLIQGLTKANKAFRRQKFAEAAIPMTGIQYGVFISLALVCINEFLLPQQLIEGMWMKFLVVMTCGFLGRSIGTFYLDIKKSVRQSLLQAPKDVSNEDLNMFKDLFPDKKEDSSTQKKSSKKER